MVLYLGSYENVAALLECRDCNINVLDAKERTPLHWACASGLADIAALMIGVFSDSSLMLPFSCTNCVDAFLLMLPIYAVDAFAYL